MPVDGKPVIGVLGGIGSGKSTVARRMAESFGGMRIDADADARAALDEPDVRDQLVRWWGPSVLTGQGGVDREAVASIVFDDEAERKRLESVVHPKVAAQREAKLAAAAADPSVRFVVLDVPLLAEVGWTERCDALVFVEAARSTRADRVRRSRGWDEAELARREKNQMRLDRKRDLAHYVVRNDASEAECLAQVREVVSRILEER